MKDMDLHRVCWDDRLWAFGRFKASCRDHEPLECDCIGLMVIPIIIRSFVISSSTRQSRVKNAIVFMTFWSIGAPTSAHGNMPSIASVPSLEQRDSGAS